MRQQVFDKENEYLANATAAASGENVSIEAYQNLLSEYEKLLRQAEKIVSIGDLTQHKLIRAQKMLHRAIQRYKATAEQKGELLSMVSHDIKNKVAPIKELTHWVIEDVDGNQLDHAKELLGHISDAAEQLVNSVNHSLQRESSRSTSIVPVFEWADVSRLATSSVETQQPCADRKDISIKSEIEGNCEAKIDEFLLGEVFENLINNAIKFSQPGSKIFVTLRTANGAFIFSVRDQGPGLSDEDKQKMFGRYQTLSARPTGGEVSTGIGLFITHKLVGLHGGSIEALSDGPGKGTTFVVTVPMTDEPSSELNMSEARNLAFGKE